MCWNCGTTRSQMCSLSFSSCASYRDSAESIATRPHSEHSLSAMRSLFRIVGVTLKMAGSDEEVEGCDVTDV
jgi:hypothetical protein